jgi:hypothetical protein
MAHPRHRKKPHKRSRRDPDRARAQAQREESRRRDREQRRQQDEAAAKREKRKKRLRSLATPALVGLGVFAVAFVVFRPSNEVDGVQRPEEIPAEVLAAGETFDYGTPTPTSGPYAPETPTCGVFAEQVAAEDAVAALHAGAVVLWHRPDATAAAAELEAIAALFDSHVLVSPNDAIESPVVAAAWNRLMTYDEGAPATEFVETYRDPGDGDCPIPEG